MAKKKRRRTRNREANELLANIRSDDALITVIQTSFVELWDHCKAGVPEPSRSIGVPSRLITYPATDLLIELIENHVSTLKSVAGTEASGIALEALSQKASLYFVVDDLLQQFAPDYTSMAERGYEIVDESQTSDRKTANPEGSSNSGCLVIVAALLLLSCAGVTLAF